MAVPWREWSLAAAVIAAAAAPVMLVASADVWRAASEDDLTELTLARASRVDNGAIVSIESTFDAGNTERADAALAEALDAVPELDAPTRTTYTFAGAIAIGEDRRAVGPPGRLLARAGVLDAITVVARLDASERTSERADVRAVDVWVTTWFAARHDLALADRFAFQAAAAPEDAASDTAPAGGAIAELRVVGLYEPLWTPDGVEAPGRDAYWADVPPELVPTHIAAFDAPNFELLLTDEPALLTSGLNGEIRWDSPLRSLPTTFDGMRRLRDRVRALESALVGTGELGDAMTAISVAGGRAPRLTTDLFGTVASVESAAARLSAPLASAQAVGGIVGMVAMVAVGLFFVERRRTEFRLLASEGERSPTMSARVAAQLAAPVVVGAAAGILAALVGPRWFGPADRLEVDELVWWKVAATAIVALAVAAVTAGVLGSRTLLTTADVRTRRTVIASLAIVLVVVTAGAWVQVGRTAAIDSESLDLVVVVLPVLAVSLAVTVVLAASGRVWRAVGRHGERLPTEGFLALRRLAGGSVGIRVVGGVLGLGVGLLVFAIAFTSTVDRTVDAKLAAELGGETSVTLIDDLPPDFVAPAPTTVIRTSDTLTRPGTVRTRVVAIDPDTFAAAVIWPAEFGVEVEEVVAAVSAVSGESVPAVAIDGEPAPAVGAFGFEVTYPYQVVERVDGFTGAGGIAASLLVSGDALDGLALAQQGYGSREEAAADDVRLPTDRFRQRLITAARADEIVAALDAADVRYRDVVSRSERRSDPSIAATRSAFGYLGVIGIVAATAALVSLVLSLSAQRRVRALTAVMTRTMGLSAARAALVTVIELVAVMSVAVVAGFAAAPLLVRRLSVRFDPAPDRPPVVAPIVAWAPLLAASAGAVFLIAIAVWIIELRAGRRPAGEVLRDAA